MADDSLSDIEEWRPVPVPGWEVYEVSNLGRVRRMGPPQHGAKRGRVLKQVHHKTGHRFVNLHLPHDTWMVAVSRLIALAFIGPPPSPKHHAAHDDGKPANNVVGNIKWATAKENQADRRRHGTHGRKLNEVQARWIIESNPAPAEMQAIADRFGVLRDAVRRVVIGRTWSHLREERNVS